MELQLLPLLQPTFDPDLLPARLLKLLPFYRKCLPVFLSSYGVEMSRTDAWKAPRTVEIRTSANHRQIVHFRVVNQYGQKQTISAQKGAIFWRAHFARSSPLRWTSVDHCLVGEPWPGYRLPSCLPEAAENLLGKDTKDFEKAPTADGMTLLVSGVRRLPCLDRRIPTE